MKRKFRFQFIFLIITGNLNAAILNVPGNYSTIQAAINASVNGDTIVVSPGTYFENINLRGKNILLTSLYYVANDTAYISSTIINGSSPVYPDTASCVIYNSGEDTTSILQGFTLTGGTGTKWNDVHGAGLYREGGGILIELSSPKIIHNIIKYNSATNISGVLSAGGGGIRIGDGNPVICSNAILYNQGRYGAGIVLNYTGCQMTNNIIASNTGGQDYFGGSGIWIYGNLGTTPKLIINNSIINNYSSLSSTSGTGGISAWLATNVIIKNNILWGNLPSTQIRTSASIPLVSYSDIQNGYTGTGNINTNPLFANQNYLLDSISPCIDAGDTANIYNDLDNMGNPGHALFPSNGLLSNDMGAYGGPCAALLPFFQSSTAMPEAINTSQKIRIFPNPFSTSTTLQTEHFLKNAILTIYTQQGQIIAQIENISGNTITINRSNLPEGVYFIQLVSGDSIYTDKVVITE